MCKRESTDSCVVSLEDRLKVEGHSIPKRELSTGRACEYSAVLWCPLREIGIATCK